MKIRQRLLAGVLLGIGAVGHGQEARIDSFSGNGLMTWQAPTNSDCTVEWASSLSPTATWSRAWLDFLNIHHTSGVTTARVPMFYRVASWTNGLFLRMPIGRTLIFSVSNVLGQVWTQDASFAGMLAIPSMTNDYVLLARSDHYDGTPPEGLMENQMMFFRSSDNAMYMAEFVGNERMGWQNGPIGTTWTNGTETTLIETNESVTVPAGTFTGCLKFKHTDSSNNTWSEWVKPGFFMVKWVDYGTSAAPVTYQLQSWRDE